MKNWMSSLLGNAAMLLLLLRCWKVWRVSFSGSTRLWVLCCVLNVALTVGVIVLFTVPLWGTDSLETAVLCTGFAVESALYYLLVCDVLFYALIVFSFVCQYYRLYEQLLVTSWQGRVGRWRVFQRRYRLSLVTCLLLLGVVTASRLPLTIVRGMGVAGQTFSRDTLGLYQSLTQLSAAFYPYVFILLTRRVRPEFRALLPCSWARRSVEPWPLVHVISGNRPERKLGRKVTWIHRGTADQNPNTPSQSLSRPDVN